EGLHLSTHKQEQAQGQHLDAKEASQQLESSLNNAKALSEVAKNQQTDPLEVLDNLKQFLEQIEQQDQNKAAAFKQALMILSAPNSIAMSSNQDIHLSADGQLSQHAGESLNFSTQKSLIAHASDKISLFAAQQGARLYTGKGKIELQAQGDGADLIARKDIQIISTEEAVYITSPKEINLTVNGSQLKLNDSGVFSTTGGKFEVKAGQHIFEGGEKSNYILPELPSIQYAYSNKLDVFNVFKQSELKNIEYSVLYNNGKIKKGVLDQYGRTDRIRSHEKEKVKILIGGDEWHYYIENFGGSKYEDTVIQFLDFLGEAIPNLIFQLSDESNKVILVGKTDENGEAVFKCPRFNFPLLSVKSIIDNDFKPIIRIENNYVRGITLISPKILKDIELLQESEEKGAYRRSNYSGETLINEGEN
ncbi:DUF2345 domain-containing protein, partial [uncultured Acinetobacter sp.]|uniref:DUF2345 domain-containing protein n=1 Tax=uncultured Acinetobacter sp. TaxID=165433 RepID=UPI00258DBED9